MDASDQRDCGMRVLHRCERGKDRLTIGRPACRDCGFTKTPSNRRHQTGVIKPASSNRRPLLSHAGFNRQAESESRNGGAILITAGGEQRFRSIHQLRSVFAAARGVGRPKITVAMSASHVSAEAVNGDQIFATTDRTSLAEFQLGHAITPFTPLFEKFATRHAAEIFEAFDTADPRQNPKRVR